MTEPTGVDPNLPRLNRAVVVDGIMTVTLFLSDDEAGFAKAIGSLVLAQDMVKSHFAQKAMREKVSGIIRPRLAN